MQPSWYEDPRTRMRERSVGVIALIGLLGFVTVAGTIFAYYFLPNPDLLLGAGDNDPRKRKLLQVALADIELLVPSNLVARVKKRTLGGVHQLDLEISWPYDPNVKAPPPEEITDHSNQLLLTFLPKPLGPSEQERFAGIYRPYIAGRPTKMQAGLHRYVFATSSPYADIEYYIGKIGSSAVFLKCELRASSLGPKLCSNTLQASDKVSLRYHFARKHLADWREIDHTVRQLLLQIIHLRQPTPKSG